MKLTNSIKEFIYTERRATLRVLEVEKRVNAVCKKQAVEEGKSKSDIYETIKAIYEVSQALMLNGQYEEVIKGISKKDLARITNSNKNFENAIDACTNILQKLSKDLTKITLVDFID